MVKSARRAVTGDGVCIGLTYKDQAFVHPKTKKRRELIKEIVAEIKSHDELQHNCYTSIQINHTAISAPTPTATWTVVHRLQLVWEIALVEDYVLRVPNGHCIYATTQLCLTAYTPIPQ